jgi:hypothetical protein
MSTRTDYFPRKREEITMPSEVILDIEKEAGQLRDKLEAIRSVTCRACGQINQQALPTSPSLHPMRMNHLYTIVDGEDLCAPCRLKYPPSLLKATYDYFDYALQLRTGEVFYFASATIYGDFVSLELIDDPTREREPRRRYPFERGIDVRASDIVWCADAPYGS